MSKHNWKPGDIALVTWDGETQVRLRTTEFAAKSDVWRGRDGYLTDEAEGMTVRPLVVLDPDDREQVERLESGMARRMGWGRLGDEAHALRADALGEALRSLVAPPRPQEPPAFGAVVKDAYGKRWVHMADEAGTDCTDWVDEDGEFHSWDYIKAVAVLSDGVA